MFRDGRKHRFSSGRSTRSSNKRTRNAIATLEGVRTQCPERRSSQSFTNCSTNRIHGPPMRSASARLARPSPHPPTAASLAASVLLRRGHTEIVGWLGSWRQPAARAAYQGVSQGDRRKGGGVAQPASSEPNRTTAPPRTSAGLVGGRVSRGSSRVRRQSGGSGKWKRK